MLNYQRVIYFMYIYIYTYSLGHEFHPWHKIPLFCRGLDGLFRQGKSMARRLPAGLSHGRAGPATWLGLGDLGDLGTRMYQVTFRVSKFSWSRVTGDEVVFHEHLQYKHSFSIVFRWLSDPLESSKSVSGWWFGTWILWLSIYWECHTPIWLSYFSEG